MQATAGLLILLLKCHLLLSVREGCLGVWEGELAWVWVRENINHFLSVSLRVFACILTVHCAVL